MRILLDEDVPVQLIEPLRHVLVKHQIYHVQRIHWSGKKDRFVLADAAGAGYDMIITNDASQLENPDETTAIRRSKLHHVRYRQRHEGLRGLALAMASVLAGVCDLVDELETATGQRLAVLHGVSPNDRFEIIDPSRNPPRYWH